eukprot:31191-Pelagococcus_subviridis.AAC.21
MPYSSFSLTLHTLALSFVYTYAASPAVVSFASAIASLSSANDVNAATGPKTSSRKSDASRGTFASTVGA